MAARQHPRVSRRASRARCVIALKGEHAGDWHDFDGNQGGGPLSALEHASGFSGRALIEYAAEVAGSTPRAPFGTGRATSRGTRQRRQARDRVHPVARGSDRRHNRRDLPGRPRARGAGNADLLFHPDLTYWDTRTGHPAMVAPVRDAAGEIIAVHRTYLADDGSGKADLPKPRMMLGR